MNVSTKLIRLFVGLAIALTSFLAVGAQPKGQTGMPEPCRILVIGFVGGLKNPQDLREGVVQIAGRLRGLECAGLRIRTFSHWRWKKAYHEIYQVFDQNQDGSLSEEEIARGPKLIVYGHSLGGRASIRLAQKLARAHIPIELTVQLDSVGPSDKIIPKNVKSAANFYQRTGWPIRGTKLIQPRDKGTTTIVGNFLMKRVGHTALARESKVSDFIIERVRALCARPQAYPPVSPNVGVWGKLTMS